MVTFSLPGENDAAPATNGTPRARPPLPFAKRAYGAASPFGNGPSKRLGTPHSASSRKFLTTRDEPPSSSLNKSNITTARNIFRASAISDSPPASVPFSPNLPQSTMKKVFAPGATPEPSRVQRQSTAHATPRGMAAKTNDKELFPMRISSPPPELSGEVLAQKVPKEWNSKGSIYADQFLSHLCPPELDEEQRRQFFCILDLRRLKYAANEIFARKDWKLNVINFAKEFEKSRSIILLRYGLYEFQNVKPSREVLKRWRREHGLPEPEEEEEEVEAPAPTPSKSAPSKKRKADDNLTKDSSGRSAPQTFEKRQTRSKVGQEDPAPIATPEPAGKNKRKASAGEEDQPAKRSTPSATKALFEKIANKPAATAQPATAAAPKPPSFTANKSASNNLARSVFSNLKSAAGQAPAQAPANANIFGYLSDASSAKNSGVDDGDEESETDSEEDDSQEAGQSEEPSGDASPAEAEDSAAPTGTGVSTRESTPGRSLFDRVTKGNDGQPVRATEEEAPGTEESAAPADQTWNPSTTPLKFAPTSSSMFGKPSTASTGSATSIFAPKSTAPSNLFGAAKQDASADTPTPKADTGKDGGESDKENDSQPAKKPMFEAKPPTPASQPFGSLFQQKPASTTAATASEPAKPTSNLFGAGDKPAQPASNLFGASDKSTTPATSNLFGASSKPAESTPVMQSSTLFGAKSAEPAKSASEEPSAPASGVSTPATGEQATTAAPLFGAKTASAAAPSPSLFGAGSAAPTTSLFGSSSAAKPDTPASGASTPVFNFGGNTTGTTAAAPASKPLFGAPKSPPASNGAGNMFGSPMKQDDQSPAKKQFTGSTPAASAAPSFSFGGASSAPASNIFGGATNNAATNGNNTGVSFGSDTSANAGSGGFGGFNFSAGGDKSTNSSFNNPFTSGGAGAGGSAAPPTGGMFNFGGSSAPSSGASTPFQFGSGSGNTAASSGVPAFGGNNQAANSTPMFGGASTGGSSAFNFTAAPTSQPQAAGSIFGANQAAPAFLQPPAGGSSTTGTSKSPFPNRKIAPLKRRK